MFIVSSLQSSAWVILIAIVHNCYCYSLQNNVYFRLGQLTSMAFVQGAPGFHVHVFSSSIYNYLAGMKVDETFCVIADPQGRQFW